MTMFTEEFLPDGIPIPPNRHAGPSWLAAASGCYSLVIVASPWQPVVLPGFLPMVTSTEDHDPMSGTIFFSGSRLVSIPK